MELFKVCVTFDDGGDIWLGDAFEEADDICLALDWMSAPCSSDAAFATKPEAVKASAHSLNSKTRCPGRVVRLPKSRLEATIDSLHYEYLLPKSLPASLRTARHPAEVPEGYKVEFLAENPCLKRGVSMQRIAA